MHVVHLVISSSMINKALIAIFFLNVLMLVRVNTPEKKILAC